MLYDEVPYPPLSYIHTHPDRLATLATLLGLTPAPVERCRVLELGCASGGNLLPMAYYLPNSTFVGIDASARQVATGQGWVATLGLSNLTLRCLDILTIEPELGEFDYIIAHGVYSWVPAAVRDKLLQICKAHLAPHGVAYVSYNTYPGYHMTNIVREAMRFQVREITDPQQQVAAARNLIHFLADAIPETQSAYGAFLRDYDQMLARDIKGSHAAFLLHDELAAINEPVYFHQFVNHAVQHGLQYLVEAELRTVFPHGFPPAVVQQLQALAHDTIAMEQYLDFLRNRMFRQTLLCHADAALDRTLRPQRVQRCTVRSQARPLAETPDLAGATVERFRSPAGHTLSIDHPVSKAAFCHLNACWPQAIPFATLLSIARARLGLSLDPQTDPAAWQRDAHALAANLLRGYSYDEHLVELHTFMPHLATTLTSRPQVSPVARWQAQTGPFVTTGWHERVQLEPLQLHLLTHLNGMSDRESLCTVLTQLMEHNEAKLAMTMSDPTLSQMVDGHLHYFITAGLCIG